MSLEYKGCVAPRGELPVRWVEGENVRWKAPSPGDEHACGVVWGDRIFVLSTVRTVRVAESVSAALPRRKTEPPFLLAWANLHSKGVSL